MINISDSEFDNNAAPNPGTEPIYEVEKILDHRYSQAYENVVEYKIKWKGYADKYNTWENEKNIYSKGLIQEYWRKQSLTLSEFKNKSHAKKNTAHKADRKQLEKEIRDATLTATPPSGLVWSDVEAIANVFFREPSTYFAEVKWRNHPKNTYIPTRIIKKHRPVELLMFYEKKLEYYIPDAS